MDKVTEEKIVVGRTLHLCITMDCNQRCPDCCNGMSLKTNTREHASVEEIALAGPKLGHFDIVIISGGEPTTHPDFPEVVKATAENYDYRLLVLATNGYRLMDSNNYAALKYFNQIRLMKYIPPKTWELSSNPKCGINNSKVVEQYIKNQHPGVSLVNIEGGHLKNDPEKIYPCIKLFAIPSVFKDRIYPCCTAAGLPSSGSVEITPNWRKEILGVPLPCGKCPFGQDTSEFFDIDTKTMIFKRKKNENK